MMPSRPINFDGCERLIAFRKCESENDAVGSESPEGTLVEEWPMLCLLETLLKYAANPLQIHMSGSDGFHQSQVEWDCCGFS